MQIIKVDIHPLIDPHPHAGEPLRRQTIGATRLRALRPLHALKVHPGEMGEGIQAGADARAAGGRRAVGVRIAVRLVDSSVVVEVFLDVDDIVVVLGEATAHLMGVGGFVAFAIRVQEGREAGDILGEDAEGGGGCEEWGCEEGEESDAPHGGVCLVILRCRCRGLDKLRDRGKGAEPIATI